jgi:hypothetical protein
MDTLIRKFVTEFKQLRGKFASNHGSLVPVLAFPIPGLNSEETGPGLTPLNTPSYLHITLHYISHALAMQYYYITYRKSMIMS